MISKNAVFLCLVIFAFSLENAGAWRTFWKGRRRDGNLKHPPVDHIGFTLPPDEWFEQKLDHLDESNEATWKQVGTIFVLCFFFFIVSPLYVMSIYTEISCLPLSIPALLHERDVLQARRPGVSDDRRRGRSHR